MSRRSKPSGLWSHTLVPDSLLLRYIIDTRQAHHPRGTRRFDLLLNPTEKDLP